MNVYGLEAENGVGNDQVEVANEEPHDASGSPGRIPITQGLIWAD
jgi:hypothetical protein